MRGDCIACDALLAFGPIPFNFFVLWPFETFGKLKLSARYLKSICARDLKLGQLMGDDE